MKIMVIGTGYVGLVTGACFSDLGHEVVCIDKDQAKLDTLSLGKAPFFEPGLSDILSRNTRLGRLKFSSDLSLFCHLVDAIFIAVGTPQSADGSADLSAVFSVADILSTQLLTVSSKKIVVVKSTVPVGTSRQLMRFFSDKGVSSDQVSVVSNPEFLREGSAIQDFFKPDRVVLGSDDQEALSILSSLYESLYRNRSPVVCTGLESSELSKYASNAFLSTKISFINEMANLSEKCGADVTEVAKIMGMDGRIGPYFLHPGPGYGGSCFPKDTHALLSISQQFNVPLRLTEAVCQVNDAQKQRPFEVLSTFFSSLKGMRIGILGVSYKPNTDDIRDSATLTLIDSLCHAGVSVCAYDPEALVNAKRYFGDRILFASTLSEVFVDSDAVILMTEWNEFRDLPLSEFKPLMRGDVFLDFRNLYTRLELKDAGFRGFVLGRSGNF